MRSLSFIGLTGLMLFAPPLFALPGGRAHAVVIVIGGGVAQDCYRSAEYGDVETAFELCTRALRDQKLSPRDSAATFINRSVIRLRARDYAGAVADCDESISRFPSLGEAYVNRGAALLNLGRPNEALATLDTAIRVGLDKMHLAYYNRGLAHEKLDDPKGAIVDFRKALELNPMFIPASDELMRLDPPGPVERS